MLCREEKTDGGAPWREQTMERVRTVGKDWIKAFDTAADEKKKEFERRNEMRKNTLSTEETKSIKHVDMALKWRRKKLTVLPVPNHIEWETHWGSSSLCSICETPAINDCTQCKKCNSISHNLCIDEVRQPQRLDGPDYVCTVCVAAISRDLKEFEEAQQKKREKELLHMCEVIIGSKAKTFLIRKEYRRKAKAIVTMQAFVRRMMAQTRFNHERRSQMRLLIVEVKVPPRLDPNHLVIVTAYDTLTQCQLIRIDKSVANSRFVLYTPIYLYIP